MDKKNTSKRLRSEFNDLKRTPLSVSKEMDYPIEKINSFLEGEFETSEYLDFLINFEKFYPVDISDLYIALSDTDKGIKFCSRIESDNSSRILSRINKKNEFSEYYEYKDTAKSKLSYFYPEWIAQLRHVENNNPLNKDVVYNHGHFLHQLNLFVGPVNYYYEINNKKYCVEMNTGDTSYISPFVKHTFASRDPSQKAYIIAVTNGGYVKHSLKEFNKFGLDFLNNSVLPVTSQPDLIKSIIQTALKNELLSIDEVNKRLKDKQSNKIIEDFYNLQKVTLNEIFILAEILNINPGDLIQGNFSSKEEVVDKKFNKDSYYYFPCEKKQSYKIYRTAQTNKISNLKGFLIQSLTKIVNDISYFDFSLNIYLINYGNEDIFLHWIFNKKKYSMIIKKDESVYIQPNIKFGIICEKENNWSYVVAIDTGVSLETKKELSFFKNPERSILDESQWYSGKKGE